MPFSPTRKTYFGIGPCNDFRYVRLGNVKHVQFCNLEFGDVAVGNVELFGSVVCGLSVIQLLLTLEGLHTYERGYINASYHILYSP